MNKNSHIDDTLEHLRKVFEATQVALDAHSGDQNLQFPILLDKVATEFDWDEKQLREHDGVIRLYVRNHKDWCVSRGAKGGIMRASDKVAKDLAKTSKKKNSISTEIKNIVEAEVAAKIAASSNKVEPASDSSLEDEDFKEVFPLDADED